MRSNSAVWLNPCLITAMKQMTQRLFEANQASSELDDIPTPVANRPRFYSFYYQDNSGRIVYGEDEEFESDADAIHRAQELLTEGSFPAAEVWFRGARLESLTSERKW